MKKIIGILLIGFLGFLGCSDNDDTTNTVGQAVPVAPFGIKETMAPSYEWTPVQYATRYRLMVQNIAEETIIDDWFTAEGAGCDSEENLCLVTPEDEIIGAHTWKVLACAGDNCGLWSDTLSFSYNVMGAPQERFTDHGDGTVTDNNTKIIWSKNANLCGRKDWQEACSYSEGLILAGHSDWRLPSLHEFESLIDRSNILHTLPVGNPFINFGKPKWYWTATPYSIFLAYSASLYNGRLIPGTMRAKIYVWPVRSGN